MLLFKSLFTCFTKRVDFLLGYPIPRKKIPIPGIKIPKLRIIPNLGGKKLKTEKIPKNPDGQKTLKTQNFHNVFQIFVENFKSLRPNC